MLWLVYSSESYQLCYQWFYVICVGFDAININMVNTVLNIIDPPGENSFMQL
jgi:hypothetical protein